MEKQLTPIEEKELKNFLDRNALRLLVLEGGQSHGDNSADINTDRMGQRGWGGKAVIIPCRNLGFSRTVSVYPFDGMEKNAVCLSTRVASYLHVSYDEPKSRRYVYAVDASLFYSGTTTAKPSQKRAYEKPATRRLFQ